MQSTLLERVVALLEELNEKLDIIVILMKKTGGRFGNALETAGKVVGIFSFLSIIDIILNWLKK